VTTANRRRTLSVAIPTLLFISLLANPAKAAIAIDANISVNQATAKITVATAAFSTVSGNELLLAFVSTDHLSGANTQVSSVAGGGLTWTLVVRANAQSGTSEIWRAFSTSPLSAATVTATLSQSVASSMTVLSFSGVNTSGTNGSGAIGATASASKSSGAPTATLVTTQPGSWVFGVANDFDNAISRTVPAGQALVHQYLSSTGDTYWVQMQSSTTPLSGTSVSINDTAPTADRYNLAIVEVLAATGGGSASTISGTLNPASVVNGSVITLSLPGGGTATTTPDGTGNYSFANLANGTYTLTPSKSGQTFNPASQTVTIAGSNVAGVNFALQTWSITGTITPATASSGTTLALSGAASATTTPDGQGNYSFTGLPNGAYTVTPSNSGFTFNPVNQAVTINRGNPASINFTATANPTWSISGNVSPASLGSGTVLTLSGSNATTTADVNGNYSFANLTNGTYTVTPNQGGETFVPPSQSANVNGGSVSNLNFTAQPATTGALAIDVTVSKDATTKATTVTTPAFSTNSGNELLLAFVASDHLSGSSTTVTGVTGGSLTWVLVRRTNAQSGTAEIWRAFAPTALSNATVTATISQSVLSSIAVVSFIGADTSGSNGSGAIGAVGGASAASGAPTATLTTTRNNSWVIGVGDDFDKAIARTLGTGQTLVHQILTSSGDTYWVQRQTNPTPTSGTLVEINDPAPTTDRYNLAITEVLPSLAGAGGTPPTVSINSPAPGATVSGTATISANAASQGSTVTGVQFLLDQTDLGARVTSTPYSISWDTTTATPGTHTLSAIAYNSAGLSAAANPITVTVDNSGDLAAVGSWSSPVNLPAVAVNLVLLKNNTLLFYQDGSTPTVWDYTNNTFTSVTAPVDLFCSGQTMLPDGRILVVGGHGTSQIGIPSAEIFDPANDTWTILPKMSYSRWYPTATTLADGRVIVMGGWQTTNHTNAGIPEIYDPATNTWTKETNANNPFETYPFIYQLSDGRLIHVNGSEYATVTDILDLNTMSWSTVDPNITDGGSSVMYLPDKIMKAGSASDSQETGSSANTTYVLDMTQPSAKWKQTASMAYPRSFLNLTELPDGTVLATGGETDKDGGKISNAVYAAELWSPASQSWRTLASMHTPREYHGTALLLPDGRVVESGMGADFGNVPDQLSAEFFSPPYLFKGPRPTVTQAPTQISYGQNFFVAMPDATSITSAVLIRTGAVTHFFDMNTRFVPTTFQQAAGGLTLTAPANANQAPPGYYMLFLVNSNGVPSIAPIIQLH
jgi:hypothetical protein